MPRIRIAVPLFAVLCLPGAAWADAIDGHWCHTDGRRMQIEGPSIVTPAGAHAQGDYSRHAFSYGAADQKIAMVLLNEMMVRVTEPGKEPETWRRCGPPVSARPNPGARFAQTQTALPWTAKTLARQPRTGNA